MSPKKPLLTEANPDLISNLPSNVTDNILKSLPLSDAAKMCLLSRKWRQNWLSVRYIIVGRKFREKHSNDWPKISNIISNILLHHNGLLYKFHLDILTKNATRDEILYNLSQWLSILSRTHVKKITIINRDDLMPIPSHIYFCKELENLKLEYFVLNHLPNDFECFSHLRTLELNEVSINNDSFFESLMAKCPRLTVLVLRAIDMSHVVIDAPSLEILNIKGVDNYPRFKNVGRLTIVSLCLEGGILALDPLRVLASSCQLQRLHIEGHNCKFLAAGGVTELVPLPFNHVNRLCLTRMNLACADVHSFVLGMVQSCPSIKLLTISFCHSDSATLDETVVQPKLDYNGKYKLNHLLKVAITGITGSATEIKIIEYVLANSIVLEKLFYKCGKLPAISELEVSRDLLRLPRASTKAQLVWLKH